MPEFDEGKLIEEASKWRLLLEKITSSEVKSPWALISMGVAGAYAAYKMGGGMDGVIAGVALAIVGVAWLVERRYKCLKEHEHQPVV